MYSEQNGTGKKGKTVQETSKRTQRWPKDHVNYWKKRLFKNCYSRQGEKVVQGDHSVKIQWRGHRETFNLGTGNQATAAELARDIFCDIRLFGWEGAKNKHKPKISQAIDSPTIGQFLDAIKERAGIRQETRAQYERSLRKIVAEIRGWDSDKGKYCHRPKGKQNQEQPVESPRQRWITKIHAVKLAELTPAAIQKWKVSFIKKAGDDPLKQRAARTSANTFLRNARSLFAPKVLQHLEGLAIPSPIPFSQVAMEKRQSMRYRSEINPAALVAAAQNELAIPIPEYIPGDPENPIKPHREAVRKNEMFKAFLLGLGAGLRRGEIDMLRWGSIRWNDGTIRIEAHRYFTPKSEESAGDVDVDPELLAILQPFMATGKGEYVLRGPTPKSGRTYANGYRCSATFDALSKWLRKKGVSGNKPIHTLRKEFGSLLCDQAGIFAASAALRHAGISLTRNHYVDRKRRVFVKFSSLTRETSPRLVADN